MLRPGTNLPPLVPPLRTNMSLIYFWFFFFVFRVKNKTNQLPFSINKVTLNILTIQQKSIK
jgi:hypothetical protein